MGSVILVEHDIWGEFLREAFNPDIQALVRRDAFINRENERHPYWREGNDLVTEIPDIDIEGLQNESQEI